jgi:hypothetical protein
LACCQLITTTLQQSYSLAIAFKTVALERGYIAPSTIDLGSGFGGNLLPQGFVRGNGYYGLGGGFSLSVVASHGGLSSRKVQAVQECLAKKT